MRSVALLRHSVSPGGSRRLATTHFIAGRSPAPVPGSPALAERFSFIHPVEKKRGLDYYRASEGSFGATNSKEGASKTDQAGGCLRLHCSRRADSELTKNAAPVPLGMTWVA